MSPFLEINLNELCDDNNEEKKEVEPRKKKRKCQNIAVLGLTKNSINLKMELKKRTKNKNVDLRKEKNKSFSNLVKICSSSINPKSNYQAGKQL